MTNQSSSGQTRHDIALPVASAAAVETAYEHPAHDPYHLKLVPPEVRFRGRAHCQAGHAGHWHPAASGSATFDPKHAAPSHDVCAGRFDAGSWKKKQRTL